jgi:hypothetical protein
MRPPSGKLNSEMLSLDALDKMWTFGPAQMVIGQFLQSFKDFPPPAKIGPGGIEKALEAIQAGSRGAGK